MPITPTLLVTILCAVLSGYVWGRLHAKRKQKLRRASLGVNYRKEPEPVWAQWSAEIGKAISGRKDWR